MPSSGKTSVFEKYKTKSGSPDVDKLEQIYKTITPTKEQKAEIKELEDWFKTISELPEDDFKSLEKWQKLLYKQIQSIKEAKKANADYSEVLKAVGKSNSKLAKEYLKVVGAIDKEREAQTKLDEVLKVVANTEGKNQEIALKTAQAMAKESGQVEYLNQKLKELSESSEDGKARFVSGINKVMDAVSQVGQAVKTMGNEILDPWAKAHQAAANYARAVGMSGRAMEKFREDTIAFVSGDKIAANYNTSIEELIKLQQQYSSLTQRNIRLSNSQRETLVATAKVMGESTALDFTAKLENFGIGMEKSGKLASDMFGTATKSGVNFEKYTKSVTDNLRLVQSYGFKNGVQGLASMARKATELKLDMQQVAAFADKVSTVEGAITTSANLQVLGGPFSQFADPMGMLYEGLNDLEGLQDRMVKMMSGLGTFNKDLGQVQLDAFNRVRVKEAAKSMGVSAEEMFKMINQAGVRNEIEKQLRGSAIANNEEMMGYLKNVASFNKNGEAVVDLGDGRGEVKVSQLNTTTDLEKLKKLNQPQEDNIRDIAKTLRGWDDVMQGTKKQIDATKANLVERTGIGKTVLNIAKAIGVSNHWLYIIASASMLGSMWKGANSIVGSVSNARGAFGGRDGGHIAGGAGGGIGAGSAGKFGGSVSGGNAIGGRFNPANRVQYDSLGRTEILNRRGDIIARQSRNAGRWQNVAKNNHTSFAKASEAAKYSRTANMAKFMTTQAGQKLVSGVVGGVAAGAMSGAMHLFAGDFKRGGGEEGRERRRTAVGGAIGATILGGLGTALLGPVGGMFGSMVGEAVGGAIGKWSSREASKVRSKKKNEIIQSFKSQGTEGRATAQAFSRLQGDYSKRELEKLRKALADGKIEQGELNDKLLRKMKESGDEGVFDGFEQAFAKSKFGQKMEVKDQMNNVENATFNLGKNATFNEKANGGFIEGPSHKEGGVPILGTSIAVEGGEYVINKEATANFLPILEKINSEKTFSKFDALREIFNTITEYRPGGQLPNNIQTTSFATEANNISNKTTNINSAVELANAISEPAKVDVTVARAPKNNEAVKGTVVNNYYFNSNPSSSQTTVKPSTSTTFNSNVYGFTNEMVKGTPDSYVLQQPSVVIAPAKNNIKSGIQPLTVAPTETSMVETRGGRVEVSPVKIDISGTINLNGGGKNVDITKLIETPEFMTQLAQIIENRLSESDLGGNFKEGRKNKMHTYMV